MIENKGTIMRHYGLTSAMLALLLLSLGAAMGIMRFKHQSGVPINGFGTRGRVATTYVNGMKRYIVRVVIPMHGLASYTEARGEITSMLQAFAARAGQPAWLARSREVRGKLQFFTLRAFWNSWRVPGFVFMAALPRGNSVRVLIYHGAAPVTPADNTIFHQLELQLPENTPS